MRIVRRGRNNYQGDYEVNLENAAVEWNGHTLYTCADRVRDFAWNGREPASKAIHDYQVEISLSEFAAQVHELAKAADSQSARLIASSLRPSLHDLLTLALLCARPRRTNAAITERPTQE